MKSNAGRQVVLVAIFAIFFTCHSLEVRGQQPRTITVIGTGTAAASPNRAINPLAGMMGIMGMGGQSACSIEFALDNPEPVRAAAFTAAMKDARTRATTLARLAQGKLGPVISNSEVEEKEPAPISITSVTLGAGDGKNDLQRRPYSSDKNQPVRIQQKLRVVFAFESE